MRLLLSLFWLSASIALIIILTALFIAVAGGAAAVAAVFVVIGFIRGWFKNHS